MRFSRQRPLPLSRAASHATYQRGAIIIRTIPRATARAVPLLAPSSSFDGKTFATKKIRHAVELAGACMLMGLFVVLALFA